MKNALTIARYTFIEVYRSRIMIGLLILSFAMVVVSYVASELAYGAPAKVALDFGMGVMSLSNIFVAIFIGITLLSKEIETKTLYMIISRPLSRSSFLAGKILGLSSVLIFNTLFLTTISIFIFHFLGGEFTNLIIWTGFFSLFEAFVLMLFAVLFSLISNMSMSAIFSIIILTLGHTVNNAIKVFSSRLAPFVSKMLITANVIIPDLERFNVKDFLLYRQSLSSSYLWITTAYGMIYICALFSLIAFIFNRKNLD